MPLVFALLLLLAIPSAFAMGSPTVVFLFGGCAIALGVAFFATLLAKVRTIEKLGAMAVLGLGVIAILALNQVPDYDKYSTWIDTATLLAVAAAVVASYAIVRRSRR